MVKIEEYKELQHNIATEKFFTPKKLYLSLSQHIGEPSKPCVKVGDRVTEAEMVACGEARVSSNLHSPCQGKVVGIDNYYHPSLHKDAAIVIECDGSEKKRYSPRDSVASLDKEELLGIIKNSGIVGMGGAVFPTHAKLNPPKKI